MNENSLHLYDHEDPKAVFERSLINTPKEAQALMRSVMDDYEEQMVGIRLEVERHARRKKISISEAAGEFASRCDKGGMLQYLYRSCC